MKASREIEANNEDKLLTLPGEVREKIYIHSPLSVLGLLAQTSRQYKRETAFLRILNTSINATPASWDDEEDATALAAIALLKRYPELLFEKKEISDHYGRKIFASPYQIFLGAGDIWALKQIHNDILPLIKKEADEEREAGEAQAEAQFKEWFPNCPWPLPKNFSEEMLYDDRNKRQIKEIVKQLEIVKQSIDDAPVNHDNPSDATKEAVEVLCKSFQPQPEEVIQGGLHFPFAIIKEIYETYDALETRKSFFSLSVIKPALDALSSVDGQCCRSGLTELAELMKCKMVNWSKGPERRCHPSYQHPPGKPLSLTLVNDEDKRGEAVAVEPLDGRVMFGPLSYQGSFNKNGVVLTGMPSINYIFYSRFLPDTLNSISDECKKLMDRKTHLLRDIYCPLRPQAFVRPRPKHPNNNPTP